MVLYGITESDYEAILKLQGGACAICGRYPKKFRLSVDHHHRTGWVRGLICWDCNKAIAYLRDDHARAQRAHLYLANPPAAHALGHTPVGRTGRATRKWRTKREKKERIAWAEKQLRERGYTFGRSKRCV